MIVQTSDDLTKTIEESERQSPGFKRLVEAYTRNEQLIDALSDQRELRGLSQRDVARRMHTSQGEVSRLESCDLDLRLSTLARYATALNLEVHWQVFDPMVGSMVVTVPPLIGNPSGVPLRLADTPHFPTFSASSLSSSPLVVTLLGLAAGAGVVATAVAGKTGFVLGAGNATVPGTSRALDQPFGQHMSDSQQVNGGNKNLPQSTTPQSQAA